MSNTHVLGEKKTINRPASMVYDAFQDLSRFVDQLPEDKKANVTATPDAIVTKVQGMDLGIEVVERLPYSRIACKQYGNSPFAFNFVMHLEELEAQQCALQLEFEAELPMFIKMMLGNKIKDAVKQFSDQMAAALNA